MVTLGERRFHLLMGALLLGSTFLDRALGAVLPSWNPPPVSLITLAIGLVWIALFTGYRGKNLEDRMRVLQDRVERSERRVDEHDRELAERRRPLR